MFSGRKTTAGLCHFHGDKGCFQTLLRDCFYLRLSMTWIVHVWKGGKKVRERGRKEKGKKKNSRGSSSFNVLVN